MSKSTTLFNMWQRIYYSFQCSVWKDNIILNIRTRSYRALSFSAIASYFDLVSGSASDHFLPSSLAISPTPNSGFSNFTFPRSSLQNQKKADLWNKVYYCFYNDSLYRQLNYFNIFSFRIINVTCVYLQRSFGSIMIFDVFAFFAPAFAFAFWWCIILHFRIVSLFIFLGHFMETLLLFVWHSL